MRRKRVLIASLLSVVFALTATVNAFAIVIVGTGTEAVTVDERIRSVSCASAGSGRVACTLTSVAGETYVGVYGPSNRLTPGDLETAIKRELDESNLWGAQLPGGGTTELPDYCTEGPFPLTAAQQEVCDGGNGGGSSSGGDPDGKCTSILDGEMCNAEGGQGIVQLLDVVIGILTAGVGVAATVGIVISAIQYITARDSEEQAKKARMRIFQIVLGLVVYAIMWAALQWLLPGGIFGTGAS